MVLASTVLMVRPAAFGFSEQAAASNVFQQRDDGGADAVQARALAEFDGVVASVRAAGVTVRVVDDTDQPQKPDAVFPNNWVSWRPGPTPAAVVYPMAVPSRRAERRRDVLPAAVLDLSGLEAEGAFVEGTGSLVYDHDARLAFACRSPRTTDAGVSAVCRALGYTPVIFDCAVDGVPVYHTNVVLALGPGWAVWFRAGMPDDATRDAVAAALGDRALLALTADQVHHYCGNLLALQGPDGPVTVLSRTAWAAFTPAQRARLGSLCIVDIPTIERVGGGSARCMLAEMY